MWWLSLLQGMREKGQQRREAEEAQAPASTMPRYGAHSGNVRSRAQSIDDAGIGESSMAGDESEPTDESGPVTSTARDRRRGMWGQVGRNVLNRYLNIGGE